MSIDSEAESAEKEREVIIVHSSRLGDALKSFIFLLSEFIGELSEDSERRKDLTQREKN
jgi:hypothetical protein